MERAALTSAHARARNAFSLQTSPKSALSAAEQHQAAAGEFHKAAEGVEDLEALRILDLLEKHHERLARIVKDHAQRPAGKSSSSSSSTKVSASEASQSESSHGEQSSKATATSPPTGGADTAESRVTRREKSSSIAANLASARGIPSGQHRSRHFSGSLPGLTDRLASQKGNKAPPEATVSSANARIYDAGKSTDPEKSSMREKPRNRPGLADSNAEPFNRFYSTFEGLLSKLSAPLAYAGLPLNPTDASQNSTEQAERNKSGGHYATASDLPDLNDLYSKAALKAVKDDHASLGAVQESFYVVPTAGGTVSYANILARTDRHSRRVSADATIHERPEEEDNFVDARESPQTNSPYAPRKSTAGNSLAGKKTAEELEMENDSLKQLTDNLSRRLYMWEKSAQNQTSALQQSIRNLRSSQAPLPAGGPVLPSSDKDQQIKDLESRIETTQKDLDKVVKENERLKSLVGRYRERWEKLKEGARTRRDGAAEPKGPETLGAQEALS